MRVTFVLPHAGLAGGIRVCAIYAKALAARGHAVRIVSTPKPPPTSLRKRVRSMFAGPTPKEPGHFDGVDLPHTVIDKWRPMTNADVPDGDVVIATWWETAEWVAKLSSAKGKKAYFIQHDERFVGQPGDRVEATFELPLYRITIAQWLVDLARGTYGVSQIDLVPNGVDVEQFNAPPRSKQRPPTVGLMYATAAFKGCDIALEAYKNAARNIANLKLVAFGQHHPNETLPLPNGADFTYRPAQDRIAGIYASCDAWLFASRSEGFGLPILEAMACRTPVIGTPTGAAPELISAGGGVLVKPQDPIDLARAIERICRMPVPEWTAMSDRARRTAEANTWQRCTEQFEASLLRAVETETRTKPE